MRSLSFCALALLLAAGCTYQDDDDDFPVRWPGDFNGDAFADVAVGAPLDDAGMPGSDRGRVYVFNGGGALDAAPEAVLSGTQDGGQFGFSVATIGDFNGDVVADLAVGAPFEDGSAPGSGRVHIFYGGPGLPIVGPVLSGSETGGQFGFSIARVGDLNNDGFDDLVVGAPLEDGGAVDSGRAHVFLGGATPSAVPFLTLNGSEADSRFGHCVSTAGDIDDDFFFDVAVGAPLQDGGGTDRGQVHIYRGGVGADNNADQTFSGTEDAALFGWSVAGVFDVNFDGVDDLLIGAPDDDGDGLSPGDSGADVGRAFLYFGGTTIDTTPDVTLLGEEPGSRFGEVVLRAGDVNAGGAPDFLIAAPRDDADGDTLTDSLADRGRVFVYFGGPPVDNIVDMVYAGTDPGALFGTSAGTPGDVNGDGVREIVVGAPPEGVGGIVRVFRGSPFLSAAPLLVLPGSEGLAAFGAAVP